MSHKSVFPFALSCSFVLGTSLLAANPGESIPVVVDGEAVAVIVQNDTTPRVTGLAARELQEHILAMTGVEVPVVAAADWQGAQEEQPALIVGQGAALEAIDLDLPELPLEGFLIQALPEQNVVVIAGRDQGDPLGTSAPHNRTQEFGTLYGVYELLEQWGVRWFFPGDLGRTVPEVDALVVPDLTLVAGPHFKMRNLWLDDEDRALLGEDDPATLEKRLWALRNRCGNATDKYHTRHHTPRWWELWADSNPEYLGLYRGQRGWRRNPPAEVPDRLLGRSKLCVSNPGTAEAVADLAKDAFRESDRRRSYSIGEQDGSGGFCGCSDCAALDELGEGIQRYGQRPGGAYRVGQEFTLGDRYTVFWNRVGEHVEEEFPDRYLGVYLHGHRIFPPLREEHLHPRIRAIYVNNNQVDPEPLAERLRGWSKVSANPVGLYIPPMFGAWPSADFQRITLPVMTFDNVYEGVKLARELEMAGVRGNPNFSSFTIGSHGLMAYFMTRWLWDTDQTPQDLLDDFTEKAFGPAAPVMNQYFSAIEERQTAHPAEIINPRRHDWMGHHLEVFTPEFVEELRKHLADAKEAAVEESQRERIALFEENLEFAAAEIAFERAWREFQDGEVDLGAVMAAYDRCQEVYQELSAANRPPRPLFQRGQAGTEMVISQFFDTLQVLDSEEWGFRADPYNEGVAEEWFVNADGQDWRSVSLASGYDAHGTQGSDLPVWYRATFELDEVEDPSNLRLGFRVNQTTADLYLNGEFIGEQRLQEGIREEPERDENGRVLPGQTVGSNGPLIFDIGEHFKPGEENELVVRVWGFTDRGVTFQPVRILEDRHP